jgi:hypothetical protein
MTVKIVVDVEIKPPDKSGNSEVLVSANLYHDDADRSGETEKELELSRKIAGAVESYVLGGAWKPGDAKSHKAMTATQHIGAGHQVYLN